MVIVAVVPSPAQFTVTSRLTIRSPLLRVPSFPSMRVKLMVPEPLPLGTFKSSKLNFGDLYEPDVFAALMRFCTLRFTASEPKLTVLPDVELTTRLVTSRANVGS